jgi:ABC-type nitrate/sulfonate/bicarbonate transport system substrate-binding protein
VHYPLKGHFRAGGKSQPLKVGFVPLSDSAPLIMAKELGLFKDHGLKVQLSREVGWATVRDKIFFGELDAAHALAPMVFAAGLGLRGPPTECVTALVLNLHGNAITLSRSIWEAAVKGGTLGTLLTERRGRLVFGIPFLHSSHHFLMRSWLKSLGLDADSAAQFVVVPPPQMPLNLKAGHLDGYCVGEPWNSIAVLERCGVIAATSPEIAPLHPEKVLMVRREFADSRKDEHKQLVAALLKACRYCDAPENRERVIETLSQKQYLGAPVEALRPGLAGELDRGDGHFERSDDFTIFARNNTNEPSADKAAWILDGLRSANLCRDLRASNRRLEQEVFSAETFDEALRLCNETQHDDENKSTLENAAALH